MIRDGKERTVVDEVLRPIDGLPEIERSVVELDTDEKRLGQGESSVSRSIGL